MSTEIMQIDDLLIDKVNPYAIPGSDTFSPGIPKMLGGYKGQSTLQWYDPSEIQTPFKDTDKSIACGMPSVGDYTADFCDKPAMVYNNQPGWKMEFDGIAPLIKSDYGLNDFIIEGGGRGSCGSKSGRKCDAKIPTDIFFITVLLMAALLLVVLKK
jgi:hypothetical protein